MTAPEAQVSPTKMEDQAQSKVTWTSWVFPATTLVSSAVVLGVSAASAGRVTGGGVFLALATATLAGVVWLIFRSARAFALETSAGETAVATGRRRKELDREKAALLRALKELEFDHEMGKVSDVDFREIGAQYRARAVRVLRQLDDGGDDYKELVDREVAMRLEKAAKGGAAAAAPAAAADGKCSCGASNDADADFCKKCGKRLAAEKTETA